MFMQATHEANQAGKLDLPGISSDRFAAPYFSQILHGVQDEAFLAGREILLFQPRLPIPGHQVDAVLLAASA